MKRLILILAILLLAGCSKNTIVVIETNHGTMEVELFQERAPVTTENFITLTKQGYYDNLTFHRVIRNFMIQGGDPVGDGTGGPGYTIPDEFHEELTHNKMGILSMANRGPNTGGSQFFITLVPTSWLNGKHSVFGQVIKGEDVLRKIGNLETDETDKPINPVIMERLYLR
ncbi:peptidylprolyl isomerase [Nanoarchaeota archaeon]